MFLLHNGFNVIGQANNGMELLESISPNRLPDIVIVNYKTSRPGTLDSARLIKQRYHDIKVIVNTQFDYCVPIKAMKEIGVEGLLIKAKHNSMQIIQIIHSVYSGEIFYP